MTCLKRLNDNLGQTLSDIAALAAKVRYFSWNVKGTSFFSAHELLRRHHRELEDATDKVVTSIFLNGYAHCHAGFKHMAGMTAIDDGNVAQDINGLASDLLQSYDVALISVEKVYQIAQRQGNHAVVNLLAECITVLKKHMWHLRAMQS